MKICPQCSTQCASDVGFCPNCSAPLREPITFYDGFISYRREGGAETATLIRVLVETGYNKSLFLDVDELRTSGRFDERLLTIIENSTSFILVLSPGSLDRCSNPEDWLKREIVTALHHKKNIIPVLTSGFHFPPASSLPEELRDLPNFQGVVYNHQYRDAAISEIVRFMVAQQFQPSASTMKAMESDHSTKESGGTGGQKVDRKKRIRLGVLATLLALSLAGTGLYWKLRTAKPQAESLLRESGKEQLTADRAGTERARVEKTAPDKKEQERAAEEAKRQEAVSHQIDNLLQSASTKQQNKDFQNAKKDYSAVIYMKEASLSQKAKALLGRAAISNDKADYAGAKSDYVTLLSLKDISDDLKEIAVSFIERDYWITQAEKFEASLGQSGFAASADLLLFWAGKNDPAKVEKYTDRTITSMGQSSNASGFSSVINLLPTLHERGFNDALHRIIPVTVNVAEQQKIPVYEAHHFYEILNKLDDPINANRILTLTEKLVRNDDNSSYSALNLLKAVRKFGDNGKYAEMLTLAGEMAERSKYPAYNLQRLMKVIWELGDKDGYAKVLTLAIEIARRDENPDNCSQDLMETTWELGDKDGYAKALALAEEMVRKNNNPSSSSRDLMETTWKLGDKDGYTKVLALAEEMVKKAKYPDSSSQHLLETTWELGDKDGYAKALALAEEMVRKNNNPGSSSRDLMETTWKLGDKDGYNKALALAEEMVKKGKYPNSSSLDLMETTWELGDKTGYAKALALADEMVRENDSPDSTSRDLMETTWKLGDKDGYAKALALAEETVEYAKYPDLSALDLMETTWKLGDKKCYSSAFDLAIEMIKKDKNACYSSHHLIEITWVLGDNAGHAKSLAFAKELADKENNPSDRLKKLMEVTWKLGDDDGFSKIYDPEYDRIEQLRNTSPGQALKESVLLRDFVDKLQEKPSRGQDEQAINMMLRTKKSTLELGIAILAAEQNATVKKSQITATVEFGKVAYGTKKFGSVKVTERKDSDKKFGSKQPTDRKPFGKVQFASRNTQFASKKTALKLNERIQAMIDGKNWEQLALLDLNALKIENDSVNNLEHKIVSALAEAGEIKRATALTQRVLKTLHDAGKKKSDWEIMEGIKLAILSDNTDMESQLIQNLHDKNQYMDRVLEVKAKKAMAENKMDLAESQYALIQDSTIHLELAKVIAEAHAKKGHREKINQILSDFKETKQKFSIVMSVVNAL